MERKRPIIWFINIFTIALFLSCASTPKKVEDVIDLDALLLKERLALGFDWAYPMVNRAINQILIENVANPGDTGGRINLVGNSNYLRITKDSLSGYLPYYGERQIGGGLDAPSAIVFDGSPSSYDSFVDQEKNRLVCTFTISEDSEAYNATLYIYPNKNARLFVNLSKRQSIRYTGKLIKADDVPEE